VQLDPADPMTRWLTRIAEHSAVLPGLRDPDTTVRREALRQLSDQLAVEFTAPAPDTVRISDESVVRPDGSSLRLRRYLPRGLDAPYPTQLWCHGGGFLLGSVDEVVNDRICAARAEEAGLQIISVDIRQAPEHRYPAGVQDLLLTYDALTGTGSAGTGLDVDEHRIGLGGVSSGGFTATVAALRTRDRPGRGPIHLALESPMLAFDRSGDPSESFATEADAAFLAEIVATFLPPEVRDEYALPLHVPDLSGLPPTLVVTGEFDPLRDSAERFRRLLRDAGNPVTMFREAGHLHGSSVVTAISDRSRAWQDRVSDALRAAYGTA
jgi:acetyl esterase